MLRLSAVTARNQSQLGSFRTLLEKSVNGWHLFVSLKALLAGGGARALVKDLSMQNDMITKKIAVQDPIIAFELLWEFMDLAPYVYSRVDDNCVEVDQVFRNALMQFGDIGPHVELDQSLLTAKILDSLINNDFGVFDGLIGLLAPTLGSEDYVC